MTNADEATTEADELDYAGALAELDAILAELEDETLNVDILAERVGRASELITFAEPESVTPNSTSNRSSPTSTPVTSQSPTDTAPLGPMGRVMGPVDSSCGLARSADTSRIPYRRAPSSNAR